MIVWHLPSRFYIIQVCITQMTTLRITIDVYWHNGN